MQLFDTDAAAAAAAADDDDDDDKVVVVEGRLNVTCFTVFLPIAVGRSAHHHHHHHHTHHYQL